jgi:hypothetical protein
LSASYGGYARLLNTISATTTLQLFMNVHVSRIVDHSSNQIHKTEVDRRMVRDLYYYCNNVVVVDYYYCCCYDYYDGGGGGGGGGGNDDDDDDAGTSQEQKTTIRIIRDTEHRNCKFKVEMGENSAAVINMNMKKGIKKALPSI